MTIAIRLDSTDPTPPYEQLRRQIAAAIGSGVLPTETQLPTVRQLAGDLGVATGTVMRAYAELEAAGLVRTARGAGTIVAEAPRMSPAAQAGRLAELAQNYIVQARLLGASDAKISQAVQAGLTPRRDSPNVPDEPDKTPGPE